MLIVKYKIGQSKPSRTCVIFDLKLENIILIIYRPFWPAVSRLSFVSVSLVLAVTKLATKRHNYSLRFRKHVDLDVHLVGYPEKQPCRFVSA